MKHFKDFYIFLRCIIFVVSHLLHYYLHRVNIGYRYCSSMSQHRVPALVLQTKKLLKSLYDVLSYPLFPADLVELYIYIYHAKLV